MRPHIIGGNWKLQINSISEVKIRLTQILNDLQNKNINLSKIFIALPPALLHIGHELFKNSKINLAAQNIYHEISGPFTGETSIITAVDLNVKYCLIGHSERRILFNETNEEINKKIHLCINHDIIPVLCIGETFEERSSGNYQIILEHQLETALKNIPKEGLKSIIIAYEPVWAINNQLLNKDNIIKPATPKDEDQTHHIIREYLKRNYGSKIANNMQIIYGGSMNSNNVESLLMIENIDGGLIGGASLSSEKLLPIIETSIKLST